MSKIIVIAEGRLDVVADDPLTMTGWSGRPDAMLMRLAAKLGDAGLQPLMLTEVGMDAAGDIVMQYMRSHSINAQCVTRYTEGLTPLLLHDAGRVTAYEKYGNDNGFDVTWPRIDRGDIVVFGGYASLTPRWSENLQHFLKYAATRDAVTVYVPGDVQRRCARATKVIPLMFENLEAATVTVLTLGVCDYFFNNGDDGDAFSKHIAFHCPSALSLRPGAAPVPLGNAVPLPQPLLDALVAVV